MSGEVLIYSKCFVIWRGHFQNPVGGRLYVIPKAGQSTHQNKSQTPPLIAAMRCYVASKLGDEVEVPDELT